MSKEGYCPYCPTSGGRCGVCSPDLLPTKGKETAILIQTVHGPWYLGTEVEDDAKDVMRMCRVRMVSKAEPPGDEMKVTDLPDVTIAVNVVYRMWSAPSRKEVLDMARAGGARQLSDLLDG